MERGFVSASESRRSPPRGLGTACRVTSKCHRRARDRRFPAMSVVLQMFIRRADTIEGGWVILSGSSSNRRKFVRSWKHSRACSTVVVLMAMGVLTHAPRPCTTASPALPASDFRALKLRSHS
jgi:hypothetical protein